MAQAEKKIVLVVEDDALISEALQEGLIRSGFKVLSARNGEEGLKSALKNHPNLIVLDLMMPIKTGHEMLAELRQDKWGANVPVTVLTNADDNIDIFKATHLGNTSYAIKSSMKLDAIVEMVKSRVTQKTSQ